MVSIDLEKVLFMFNTISNAMMGVYRDNPWLLDMLKKHLNEIDN
jgi:hypothetical protein